VYDENTNWRELLAHPPYKGLKKDLDIQSALGELAEALRGTPMATALGNAALEVIERGIPSEMESVRAAGWELALNAFERILTVLENPTRTLSKAWVVLLYTAMFNMDRTDDRLLRAFDQDVRRSTDPAELFELGAHFIPEWLWTELVSLRPPPESRMYYWLLVMPELKQGQLLTAISKLSEQHVKSLVAQVRALPRQSKLQLIRVLQKHPVFAPYVADFPEQVRIKPEE
jgi:hypothetical protein